jgi:hypothetical protein
MPHIGIPSLDQIIGLSNNLREEADKVEIFYHLGVIDAVS